jgi:hypothetical protein
VEAKRQAIDVEKRIVMWMCGGVVCVAKIELRFAGAFAFLWQ